MMKMMYFVVSSRRYCTSSQSFFSISGWGTDLDYCDIEWFALEMNRDHSVVFESASSLRPYHPEHTRSRLISEAKQGRAWLILGWEIAFNYCIFDSFVDSDGYSISSKGFLPTVVHVMVI